MRRGLTSPACLAMTVTSLGSEELMRIDKAAVSMLCWFTQNWGFMIDGNWIVIFSRLSIKTLINFQYCISSLYYILLIIHFLQLHTLFQSSQSKPLIRFHYPVTIIYYYYSTMFTFLTLVLLCLHSLQYYYYVYIHYNIIIMFTFLPLVLICFHSLQYYNYVHSLQLNVEVHD